MCSSSSIAISRSKIKSYVLTCAYLLEDADELLVTLSVNLREIDVLKIAVLVLLMLNKGCENSQLRTHLPCLAAKSPFVNIIENIFVATSVFAPMLLGSILLVFLKLPSTANTVLERLHGRQLTELVVSAKLVTSDSSNLRRQ
jgi:hypothetical protein